jgi:type II secretory pathway pseudopilin PulG
MLRRMPSQRVGFALTEIFAVMGGISILMTLVVGTYQTARKQARIALAENNLKQVSVGLNLYFGRYGSYPPSRSNLTEILEPFVKNTSVFSNPLMAEPYPGKTLNDLYFPPTVSEADSNKHYVTAFVSDDGHTIISLSTNMKVEMGEYPTFNPTNTGEILHVLTGETVISGILNLDPRNNTNFDFTMRASDGSVITRSMLLGSNGQISYEGSVESISTWPKGNGNQNGLLVNGQPFQLVNGRLYTIARTPTGRMRVHIGNINYDPYLQDKVATSEAMGAWWIDVLAIGGSISAGK